jgi:hypothetical protein
MADSGERTTAIDTETVRALLLANGGGAVAILIALTSILDKPNYQLLARAMLICLVLLMIGVAFAIAHNHLRRVCLAAHDQQRPHFSAFGREFGESLVCLISRAAMWGSLVVFLCAGILISVQGLTMLSDQPNPAATERPLSPAKGKAK